MCHMLASLDGRVQPRFGRRGSRPFKKKSKAVLEHRAPRRSVGAFPRLQAQYFAAETPRHRELVGRAVPCAPEPVTLALPLGLSLVFRALTSAATSSRFVAVENTLLILDAPGRGLPALPSDWIYVEGRVPPRPRQVRFPMARFLENMEAADPTPFQSGVYCLGFGMIAAKNHRPVVGHINVAAPHVSRGKKVSPVRCGQLNLGCDLLGAPNFILPHSVGGGVIHGFTRLNAYKLLPPLHIQGKLPCPACGSQTTFWRSA